MIAVLISFITASVTIVISAIPHTARAQTATREPTTRNPVTHMA
jgi:hypothetical protein